MCGICGWVGLEVAPPDRLPLLQAMCDSIRHRGPDDAGYYADDLAGCGMRRLSIVDLAGGHQPMASDDGRVQLVFNGEIYNHAALRQELAAAGATFRTRSDTEVLLRAYERFGEAALDRCNGMFGVAIWDAARRSLLLLRDRMGVKPLYYSFDGKALVYGSEVKAILASGRVAAAVNERGLWDYLTCRYVPGPGTIWRGIFKLPPGHILRFSPGDAAPRLTRYWDIPLGTGAAPTDRATIDATFESLLGDAVNLRMLADVPVGITLSGGIDSSVITALAARHSATRIQTFSVAFAEMPDQGELPYARTVARHLGTDHHEVVIDQRQFLDFLPRLVHLTDEPLADLASVPLYYVCELARGMVTVVLSGEGGDEVLGGYDFDSRARLWAQGPLGGSLGRLIRPLLLRLAYGVPTGTGGPDFRRTRKPPNMTHYLDSAEKQALLKTARPWPDSLDSLRAALGRLGEAAPLNQLLYAYSQDWLVEDLLMKADRMSMGTSLEMRTPFLDYRLVEWAAGLDPADKVGPDVDGVWRGKLPLRRLARKLLPAAIVERPKQGFPVPVYGWLSGSLREYAGDLLSGPGCRIAQWFDAKRLGRYLAQGTQPRATNLQRHILWNFLILEQWAKQWRL